MSNKYLDSAGLAHLWSKLKALIAEKAPLNHSHKYAGSSSAGGSANSAVKLDSSAGSATQPVYFVDGKPVAVNYTIQSNVPSDAQFTDTVYTHPTHTARSSGLYKITVDNQGHVSGASAVEKSDITGLGIPEENTVYTHPTSAGNKHVPSGGSDGQILGWSADGTAAWEDKDPLLAIVTTSGTGAAYTASVPGVTSLYAGLTFTLIPHTVSTTTSTTLNVNGLGAKNLRQALATTTGTTTTGNSNSWLAANKPVSVTYDGSLWRVNNPRPAAAALYGTVPVEKGGTGATTAAAALSNLGAVSKAGDTMTGILTAQNNTSYTTKQVRNVFIIEDGASLPSGSNGDICLVYTP